MQKTGTSESLPQLLPKQQLESLLWEFNHAGELSLLCFNVSLTIAVNVGSVGYCCSSLFRNEPQMQNVGPDLGLEFKCWKASGCLDLWSFSLNAKNRGTTRRSYPLLWP